MHGNAASARQAYLVSTEVRTDDLPDGALQCQVSAPVANHLRSIGSPLPMPLQSLPGKWWVADIDIAAVNPNSEPGCATTSVEVTSEEIEAAYAFFYCHVTAGPFDERAGIEGCYLATAACPVAWLGDRVSVIEVSGSVARQLASQGMTEPFPAHALFNRYWVCGMSRGVCSTHEVVAGAAEHASKLKITDGPFLTREDAEYAFDVMWEAPS